MEYLILENYINLEFGYRFEKGGIVSDETSGLEPDLITSLVSSGVLRDVNAPEETPVKTLKTKGK